jgi:hypothetical protein
MDELGVGADGIDLGAELLKLTVPLCQSSEFRCSNEGEVGGIKEEDGPLFLLFLVGQAHLAEVALGWFIRFQREIGHFLPNLNTKTTEIFHGFVLLATRR